MLFKAPVFLIVVFALSGVGVAGRKAVRIDANGQSVVRRATAEGPKGAVTLDVDLDTGLSKHHVERAAKQSNAITHESVAEKGLAEIGVPSDSLDVLGDSHDDFVKHMSDLVDLYDDRVKHTNGADKQKAKCDFGDVRYALFIDGKDSSRGQAVYGQLFLDQMLSAWKHVLRTTEEEISVHHVTSFHTLATRERFLRDGRVPYGRVLEELSCMKAAKNETFKKAILADLPRDIIDVAHNSDGSIDTIVPKVLNNRKIEHALRSIVDQYNHDQQRALGAQQQLRVLARFLRSLAWLHPFADGNGRTRTLLLQHEVRRLQLACGAMMFNNNADIYFDSSETYARKMSEGIAAAGYALSDGRNPWDDADRKKKHREAFPLHDVASECRIAFENNSKSVLMEVR
jgi:hypothetical protein